MAEKLCECFPHVFNPSPDSEGVFSLWFDTAQFAQLAVSNLRPYQCKRFSKVGLSASALNIADGVGVCKCLAPVNFFTHAFSTLAQGHYSSNVKEALKKLGEYIEAENNHVSCISKMARDDKISEKQILLVYAHHLFEPLLPNAELFIDKYIGVDASKCPYCNDEKEKIQSGSTFFGVPEMWHGRADIVLKHGKVRQTVTVAQGPSGSSSSEPSTKKRKMDSGDCNLNWTVMSKREQDQDPIPQILSQTIVNAFLVTKENECLKNFFIPSFLVTAKGVMTVMYNVPNDSLVTQVVTHPLVQVDSPDNKMDRRLVFIIWLALNFDKFELEQSVEVIKKFLKPCGFRDKISKHEIQKSYEEDVCESVEENHDGYFGVYDAYLDNEAKFESWKVLKKHGF